MSKERTQLNINIDPDLLLKLKAAAIKDGKTLTEFVTEQLRDVPKNNSEKSLEQRLSRIENFLMLDKEDSSNTTKKIGQIFSDKGAKEYGKVARSAFESFTKKKGLTPTAALQELDNHLKHYPHSNPELIFQILLGTHDLTGLEMTIAYRHGSCAMRSALNDWTNDPLENLNKAFLNAVITRSL